MDEYERFNGIGGSDVAAVLGISRFKTPVELWYEKVNKIVSGEPRPEKNPNLYWGKVMEPLILRRYHELTKNRVETCDKQITHAKYHWLIANVDGFAYQNDERIVLEAKTCSFPSAGGGWGESYTDKIPLEYQCQCQHYMSVTGTKMAHVAVLFLGNLDFKVYRVDFSQEIINEIRPAIDRFWNYNVREKVAPMPEDYNDVKLVYNKPKDGNVIARGEVEAKVYELSQIKMNVKMLLQQEDKLKTNIGIYMGNKTKLLNENGEKIATFIPRKDGVRVFKLV